MTKSDSIIKISKLNKWYGKFHALKDIDLSVGRTEKIVICGPSGSGKSTLIRCINRLEVHQDGSIQVDGIELTDDIKAIIEGNQKNKSIIRELDDTKSVRSGKYGDYIFYKTTKMSKPRFLKLKGFMDDYKNCNVEIILEWIKETYNVN